MTTIELIYFDGCPHVPVTREHVREALAGAGTHIEVKEWDQNDPAAPPHVRQNGSPTVLVNGCDVTGTDAGVAAAACRMDGAPSVDAIRQALQAAG